MIRVGSDFSGVGAFNQALIRLGIEYEEVFACDMDKYARKTFIHNYGEPKYYPENVYDREIPEESLDLYVSSPPCQTFSLAGRRKGEDDERGILFYNSHEFIQKNKPRYFIFENVKGLLSDAGGLTFRRWCEYLGGKSINGNTVIFPHKESVPYHVYYQVLNAKDYNIPQNRERVFIVGIRDDQDNNFTWPKEMFLERRLRDVLEENVDEKYFLSEKMLDYLKSNSEIQKNKGNGFKFDPTDGNSIGKAITTKEGQRMDDNFVKVNSATSKGYEIAKVGEDSINFEHPNSKTRRGRVGEKVAQTLTTSCNQGVAISNEDDDKIINPLKGKTQYGWHFEQGVYDENGITRTVKAGGGSGNNPKLLKDYRIRKLTPRECFRLMDFPDTFDFSVVSNTQAYKQAGNSICVGVLAGIINRLKLKK